MILAITPTVMLTVENEEIVPGDLFLFYQSNGTPTIRKAIKNEDWNGYTLSGTDKNPYLKIINIDIKGVLLSPRSIFKY